MAKSWKSFLAPPEPNLEATEDLSLLKSELQGTLEILASQNEALQAVLQERKVLEKKMQGLLQIQNEPTDTTQAAPFPEIEKINRKRKSEALHFKEKRKLEAKISTKNQEIFQWELKRKSLQAKIEKTKALIKKQERLEQSKPLSSIKNNLNSSTPFKEKTKQKQQKKPEEKRRTVPKPMLETPPFLAKNKIQTDPFRPQKSWEDIRDKKNKETAQTYLIEKKWWRIKEESKRLENIEALREKVKLKQIKERLMQKREEQRHFAEGFFQKKIDIDFPHPFERKAPLDKVPEKQVEKQAHNASEKRLWERKEAQKGQRQKQQKDEKRAEDKKEQRRLEKKEAARNPKNKKFND